MFLRNGSRVALAVAVVAVVGLTATASSAGAADKKAIERGKYLVTFGGCFDCHTAGYFFGKPDMARYLGGSDVGLEMPGLGVFVGPNLTPDPETGLGKWTEAQIVTALQTGKRPDGRELAPTRPIRPRRKGAGVPHEGRAPGSCRGEIADAMRRGR